MKLTQILNLTVCHFLLYILLLGSILSGVSQSLPNYKTVTIEWEIPKKSDVVGYFFSLESESGVKSKSDIGMSRKHTFSVIPGRKYLISITPYDSSKREGESSNTLEYCFTNSTVTVSLPKPRISISK